MKYHYIHKNPERFINEHEYKTALRILDESYGVTLGISRVLEFIKNRVKKCIFASEAAWPKLTDDLYLKMYLGTKYLSEFTKIDISPNMYYTDCIFEFNLKNCNSRLEWIDFENTNIEIICRLYDTMVPGKFDSDSDGGTISSAYKFIKKNNSDDSYIIGNIKIRIDMNPIEQNKKIYFVPYVGGYNINDIKNIIPLLQHEFNHIHKKIKMNINQDVTDLYNIVMNILHNTNPGDIKYRFADALYRYGIQDELNANVEQAFKEYQYIKNITQTNVWITSEHTKTFFTNIFKPNSISINTKIYDIFGDVCKKVFNIRELPELKNPKSDKEINLRNRLFVKALIKKILQNIDKLQERIKRTTKVPFDKV